LNKIRGICYARDINVNILLLGQADSGKSSFINSCDTALQQDGNISAIADVLEGSSGSVTKHVSFTSGIYEKIQFTGKLNSSQYDFFFPTP
jgi:septin family protein